MIGYGDLMLDRMERLEEFHYNQNNMRATYAVKATPKKTEIHFRDVVYLGDHNGNDVDPDLVYYATGAELKEAVKITFKNAIDPYKAEIETLKGDRAVWVLIAGIQTLVALAGWGAYLWL